MFFFFWLSHDPLMFWSFSKSNVPVTVDIFFFEEDESGPKPEALNKKAVAIVNRVRDKLTGMLSTFFCHRLHIISKLYIPSVWNKLNRSEGTRFYYSQSELVLR